MTPASWSDRLETLLAAVGGDGVRVERERLRCGVNAYVVPAFDRSALQFSLPVRIERDLSAFAAAPGGLDGVAAVAIEAVKAAAAAPSAVDLDPPRRPRHGVSRAVYGLRRNVHADRLALGDRRRPLPFGRGEPRRRRGGSP